MVAKMRFGLAGPAFDRSRVRIFHRARYPCKLAAMPIPIPPLPPLRLFEAAARHESFTKAADELGLTASAVSHGIDSLEKWLGV